LPRARRRLRGQRRMLRDVRLHGGAAMRDVMQNERELHESHRLLSQNVLRPDIDNVRGVSWPRDALRERHGVL
jgi:hypothetical protein